MRFKQGLWLIALAAGGLAVASARAQPSAAPAADPASLGDKLLTEVMEPQFGDLDAMIKRRYVRVLVPYSKMLYAFKDAQERGIMYETAKEYEKKLNGDSGRGLKKTYFVFLPVARDQLIQGLVDGRGDIAAANLTITPERQQLVDFSATLVTGVAEVVVTAPGSRPLTSWTDLAGREVMIRLSSSYARSVGRVNRRLAQQGLKPMRITPAHECLEDEDILQLVDAGAVPATVADDYLAHLWAHGLTNMTVHDDLPLNTGGEIAWAFRKKSPRLAASLNPFIKDHKAGTLFGNIMIKRYFENTDYLFNPTAREDMRRFEDCVAFLQHYAGQYDFDWLMVGAQAYQESRLDQSKRSPSGAVGVMQIKPSTAGAEPISIPRVELLENNIHAGVKYLRHVADEYFDDPAIDPFNRQFFAFAAYNAGPTRIAQLRREAARRGLNPNKWFDNVAIVAAKTIGNETVEYVANILKYYVAYKRTMALKMTSAPATP